MGDTNWSTGAEDCSPSSRAERAPGRGLLSFGSPLLLSGKWRWRPFRLWLGHARPALQALLLPPPPQGPIHSAHRVDSAPALCRPLHPRLQGVALAGLQRALSLRVPQGPGGSAGGQRRWLLLGRPPAPFCSISLGALWERWGIISLTTWARGTPQFIELSFLLAKKHFFLVHPAAAAAAALQLLQRTAAARAPPPPLAATSLLLPSPRAAMRGCSTKRCCVARSSAATKRSHSASLHKLVGWFSKMMEM